MTILPKGDWSIPGTWVPALKDNGTQGAVVICPKCGRGAMIMAKVDMEGHYHGLTVSPFECPNGECRFTDHVKLMWWSKNSDR